MIFLNWLNQLWNAINRLDSHVKTMIILAAIFFIGYPYINNKYIQPLNEFKKHMDEKNQQDEGYTLKMANRINEIVHILQLEDGKCYDVILLNYHNSKKSLQGLRYLYLNCIAESNKDTSDPELKEYWSNLEFIYYEQEITKIRNQRYLYVQNIEQIKDSYPKFYKKLLVSDAKAAAFYPIEGIDSPIGMIVILYKEPCKFESEYFAKHISPYIQKLAVILDYNNSAEYKKNNE